MIDLLTFAQQQTYALHKQILGLYPHFYDEPHPHLHQAVLDVTRLKDFVLALSSNPDDCCYIPAWDLEYNAIVDIQAVHFHLYHQGRQLDKKISYTSFSHFSQRTAALKSALIQVDALERLFRILPEEPLPYWHIEDTTPLKAVNLNLAMNCIRHHTYHLHPHTRINFVFIEQVSQPIFIPYRWRDMRLVFMWIMSALSMSANTRFNLFIRSGTEASYVTLFMGAPEIYLTPDRWNRMEETFRLLDEFNPYEFLREMGGSIEPLTWDEGLWSGCDCALAQSSPCLGWCCIPTARLMRHPPNEASSSAGHKC